MIITPKVESVFRGVTLELTSDETSHLIVALSDYERLMKKHYNLNGGDNWPWVTHFRNKLEHARSVPLEKKVGDRL